jgi:hypothetical protein
MIVPRLRRLDSGIITTNDDSAVSDAIFVSQGCLLIPVFIAAWWYYTKYACRALVRGLLRNRPENTCDDDDAVKQNNCSSSHFASMEDAYFQAHWYVHLCAVSRYKSCVFVSSNLVFDVTILNKELQF